MNYCGSSKLLRKNQSSLKKRKGFSLIELIIVVAIIGILAGIVAVKFTRSQKIAKENADYANASNIATAAILAEHDGKSESEIEVDNLISDRYLSTKPKPQSVSGDFDVDVVDGEVVVKVGEKIFYPKGDNTKN